MTASIVSSQGCRHQGSRVGQVFFAGIELRNNSVFKSKEDEGLGRILRSQMSCVMAIVEVIVNGTDGLRRRMMEMERR